MPSYDNATIAIKEAHRMAEELRMNSEHSSPICIWRAKGGKLSRSNSEYRYTLSKAWDEKPNKAGSLVMIVSSSGIERCDNAWLDREEFQAALQS